MDGVKADHHQKVLLRFNIWGYGPFLHIFSIYILPHLPPVFSIVCTVDWRGHEVLVHEAKDLIGTFSH